MKAQCGFSLIELLVAVFLLTILTIGIVSMTLAQHPGELAATANSFDASFDAARAIAATSGNGATVVIAPRSGARNHLVPGFTLMVYRGRPTAANAVSATTVMPIVSDLTVREASLGAPPFAIFLSSAGHASGLGSYPSFDSNGTPVFSTISEQPACANGSLVLTFSNGNASQTRTMPCGAIVTGSPQPLTTATPSQITLTPSSLVFYWPGAPAQSFVATEWGYTRWFAAGGFSCGASVAEFPQNNPAPPYSTAYSSNDAFATPQPPAGTPYAFAYSAASMQDAPAFFPIFPEMAGACSVPISDASGQEATMTVQVMGTLTVSPSTLSLLAGSGATPVTLGKTYDAATLQSSIVSSNCGSVASFAFATGATPSQPGSQPATALLYVTPQFPGSCSVQIADQYSGSGDPSATLNLSVTATPSPTPHPTPTPTLVPSPTPSPCPTGGSTLRGADGKCDDLYLWPVDSFECSQFNCSLLYPVGSDDAPTVENLWAAVYVPHGTAIDYDTKTLATEPSPDFYVCYAQVNSSASPVTFAYYYSDGSHPSQTVTNAANFGLSQISAAAAIPHDSSQGSVSDTTTECLQRLPAPTFTIGG